MQFRLNSTILNLIFSEMNLEAYEESQTRKMYGVLEIDLREDVSY